MNKITVIIPFLNEGEEIYNTVKNLRDTAGERIDILLINDASNDGRDYEVVATQFGTQYIRHEERKGVAASRDEAIDLCQTEFFILLDGHMRFFQTDWVELLTVELERERRTLLCCQTLILGKDENGKDQVVDNGAVAFGAYIDFSEIGEMNVVWSTFDPAPEEQVIDIPCVLGAGYACNTAYWKYLRGLEGLYYYGLDEQLISIKVWMEGGKCKLLKHIKAGHFYRDQFPYKIENLDLVYNKLYIAELFLPYQEKAKLFRRWDKQNQSFVKEAMSRLIENREMIKTQKMYYKEIFNIPIQDIIEQNTIVFQKSKGSI